MSSKPFAPRPPDDDRPRETRIDPEAVIESRNVSRTKRTIDTDAVRRNLQEIRQKVEEVESNVERLVAESGSATNRSRVEILLNETHMDGQKERLVREFGYDPDTASAIFNLVYGLTEELAEEKGKSWSPEVVDSVANLILAMYIEEGEQRRHPWTPSRG